MPERRQYERLSYSFPVRLETMFAYDKKVLDLVTRDISASGTFIPTSLFFLEGTRFVMSFTFPSSKITKFQTLKTLNGCIGRLVRSTHHGIAIEFERECQMECLKIM
jgi:PilZ domain